MVEVTQALSNPCHPAASLLREWNDMKDDLREPLPRVDVRPIQVQHRLDPSRVAELVASYQDGATIDDLAERFGVHRTTVMAHLDRSGVKRRQRGIEAASLPGAIRLYEAGWSLARVGERLGVDGETVRTTLRKAGVPIRARRGYHQ
jgi:DNA-binding transcriptional ArsR family regulator